MARIGAEPVQFVEGDVAAYRMAVPGGAPGWGDIDADPADLPWATPGESAGSTPDRRRRCRPVRLRPDGHHGGDRPEQRVGVGVVRGLEYLRVGSDLHHLPPEQDADPVGQGTYHRQVVRDEEHGDAVPSDEAAQEPDHVRLDGHVERGKYLVAQEEVGLGDQGPGDGDALALAAGELIGVAKGVGPVRAARRFSASMTRGRASRRPMPSNISSGRARISPTRRRGLSEASGFWKMNWMRRRCATVRSL